MLDVATQTFSPRSSNEIKDEPLPLRERNVLAPRPFGSRGPFDSVSRAGHARDVQLASFLPSKASTALRCFGVKTWRISAPCAIRRLRKKSKALLLADLSLFKLAVDFSHIGNALADGYSSTWLLLLLGQPKLCLNTWRVDHRRAQNIAPRFPTTSRAGLRLSTESARLLNRSLS